jgi:hypothetical protein
MDHSSELGSSNNPSEVDMDQEQQYLTQSGNDRLPYDLLVNVYDNYTQWDGIEEPLERLLLICRTWSTAAYEHKLLWTSFDIGSEDFGLKIARFWSSRVSKRIKRSGDEALLDLRFGPFRFDHRHYPDDATRKIHAELVSNILS